MGLESIGCIGAIHLIVWVLVMIDIIGGRRSLASKVVWALVVFFFPCVGLVVYLIFGRVPKAAA